MTAILWAAIGVLAMVIAVLSIKIHLMHKAARELAEGFSERLTQQTNTLIDLSCRDRQLRRLAASINCQLALLREERHRFQRGDTELKEAVTNISHDLRTPLTAICGYLDLLEREEKSEAVSRYLSLIANRAEALKSLTEELFRYSVLVSVDDTTRERVVLNEVLEESLLSFYGAMEQRGIQPVIAIPEKKAERSLNRSALSRIFGNIISNAMKYSDGDFAVTMDENGSITFSNSAKALTAVQVGKLFDRFFTVETGRSSTGLGLSIAKLLTERMGGAVSAKCENGQLSITLAFPPSA